MEITKNEATQIQIAMDYFAQKSGVNLSEYEAFQTLYAKIINFANNTK